MPSQTLARPDFKLLDSFWKEEVTRTVLPNGVTLLVKRDDASPVASVQVWVKTGSLHEGTLLGSGVSHFVEHMLFKGTTRREGRDISKTVQAHGGYINAYTTFDRTVYYIDLPGEHVGVAIDLLADAVLHSTFPADEFAKERNVILREIDMGKDDPDHRMAEALFATAFRTHPYQYPIIGHKEVFSTLSREDLYGYYKARYVPNNLVVVVAGDVDPKQVEALVSAAFGNAARGRLAPVLIEPESVQLAARAWHREEDVELTRAGLAWPIPGISHPDAPVLDLLSVVLGGGESAPLWRQVREKRRLVHTIDAHSWTPGTSGLFYVSFTCSEGNRDAAVKSIQGVLAEAVKKGFTRGALDKAIRQSIVGEINSRKTVSGQASRLGSAEVVAGDQGFSKTYFERLKTVTSKDLVGVIRAYLVPERLTQVSLNPKTGAAGKREANAKTKSASKAVFRTLKNGTKLLLLPNRGLPNVHFRLLFLGGVNLEYTGKRGATNLLATCLAKDTKRRTALEVAQQIEEVGGALYPFSGNNSFGLAAEVLPSDMDRALELLSDAVHTPKFAARTVATELEAQLAELAQDRDDIVAFGRKALRRRFFGEHPLAVDTAGLDEDLKALKPDDLRDLWKRAFVGSNTVFVAAGDFEPVALGAKLERWLARVPKGRLEVPALNHELPAEVGAFSEKMDREQAVVFQAFTGPGLKSPDYYTGEVADELFSGMSSRLFERVREDKGLAYFVRSSRITGLDTGMFSFYAGTSPAQHAEVLREIELEIERVAAGKVEPEELKRCQVRLKAGRKMGLQTNSARAMHAGLNVLYGFSHEETERYDAHVDAVTVEDLARFAKTRLDPKRRTQLVVKA